MIKEFLKRNCIFIVIIIGMFLCFLKKDSYLPINLVSYPDTWEEFLVQEKILEQTWLPSVKEIAEIKLNCKSEESFENVLQINILESDTRNVIATTSEEVILDENEIKEICFKIEPTIIVPGEQYIIQLEYGEQNGKGVWVEASTNHMGCIIDGEERNVGVAFELTYIKNSKIFWIISSLFPFASFAFLFMVIYGKKWEETIGLSMAVSIAIMFISGLFSKLELGILILYLLSFISFGLGIFFYNKKEYVIKDLLSYGLIVYFILFALLLLNCNYLRFSRWDDFSHWGLAAKDMFYSNSLAKHFDSVVRLKYYPPVTTLIEFFFCYTNKFYSESIVFVGLQFLMLGLMSVALSVAKKIIYVFPVVCGCVFIPIIILEDTYCSLHTDPVVALAIAYVLICYFTEKMSFFNILRMISGLFLLIMTKDVGVVLASLVTLVILGDILFKSVIQKKIKVKNIGFPFALLMYVFFIFFVWQIYLGTPIEREVVEGGETVVETMAVTGAIDKSGITLDSLKDVVTGNAEPYRYQVIKNYLEKLFSDGTFQFGNISFSYIDIMLVILMITLGVVQLPFYRKGRYDLILYSVLVSLGGIGYSIFILVTYMFSFKEWEALILHSYIRYLGTYVCAMLIAWLAIVIAKINEEKYVIKYEKTVLLILAAYLIMITPIEKFVITNEDRHLSDEQVYGFSELGEILRSGAKKTDKAYFVCNNSMGYADFQFKNEIAPIESSEMVHNVFESIDSYWEQVDIYKSQGIDEAYDPLIISVDEWRQKLMEYQYVVIFSPNDVFAESYQELFLEPDTIDAGTVYRVEQGGDILMLKYIGKTGIKSFR